MPPKRGVYCQVTSDEALERKLVEIVLLRDLYLERVVSLTTKVKDRLMPLDEDSTVETLSLIVLVRNTTIDLLLQIQQWQKKYTAVKRPQINGGDYMMKLLKHVDFANTLAIKRTFNFQIGRGNIFMLPLINAKTMPLCKVTDRIQVEIEGFANPDITRLAAATAVLKKSLPKKILADIMPLEHWIASRWVPRISRSSYFLKPPEASTLPKIKKKLVLETPVESPGAVKETMIPLGRGEKDTGASTAKSQLPALQRMSSNMSVMSQLSDDSIQSKSVKVESCENSINKSNSVDSSASRSRVEPPEAPAPVIAPAPAIAPTRNFNTLAMRNWFVAETHPSGAEDIILASGNESSSEVA